MTRDEAIQAMKEGKKVTHRDYLFLENWIRLTDNGRYYVDNDEGELSFADFEMEAPLTDWELFKD